MNDTPHAAAALSRPLALSEVPPEGLAIEVVTTEAERAALAELNALPAITALEATMRARRWRGDGLEIGGELRARVRQICVLTLEEFESDIVGPLELRFAPSREAPRPRARRNAAEDTGAAAPDHDPLGEDPPDPLVGGAVDLGVVVSEFLTLALDPYPRKPGARFAEPTPATEIVSPFAALKSAAKQTSRD